VSLICEPVLQLALDHIVVVQPAVGAHHTRFPLTATQAHTSYSNLTTVLCRTELHHSLPVWN
jgi:hypothetical protein